MAGSSWTNQVQNQVIVSGPNGGVFVYDPAPGRGNLIGSITDAAADPYGNATLRGVTGYSSSGGIFYAASLGPAVGGASVLGLWTAPAAAGPYTFQGGLSADSSGNMALGAVANLTLSTVSGTLLGRKDASSFIGGLSIVQADLTTHAVGNTVTAGDLTTTWSVPANDGIAGTAYTIKALATMSSGATAAEDLTIGIDINNGISGGGVLTPLATLGAAFNGSALSTSYAIPLELVLVVNAVGASTPLVYLNGPLGDTSVNRLATNSANMSGLSSGTAWNPANLNTIAIYAKWGGAGGAGQNIQTIASRLYREGP